MPETNGTEADSSGPRPGLRLELQAIDLDRDGHGLARWQGWVVVVPGLLPGERAQAVSYTHLTLPTICSV